MSSAFIIPHFRALPRDLHRIAVGGAWLFSIGSLFPLLWLASAHSPDGVARVFGTNSGGVDHGVWGLTYSGVIGGMLLWTQILAVIAANVFTLVPNNRLRRIGHGFMIGWAAWWMFGAMYLASIEPVFWTVQSIFQTTLLGCVVYRAARSGARFSRPADSRPLSADDVQASPHITELHLTQGSRSKSTLPPESTTPTRFRFESFLKSLESATATGTAALGSITNFIRSKTKRIASMMRSSETVNTRST